MIMKTSPLVTIYIPSRNYGRFLDQSIQSIVDQIYINWELFIIDEGSDDNTELVAKKYKEKYPSRIFFIKNKTPKGLQKVANEVLEKANGKYMIRLDADDWLNEIALFIMVEKLEKNSKAGIAYGNYFYTNYSGKIIGVETRHKLGDEDLTGQLPPHGACTMFETQSLRIAGGYSEGVDAQDGWDLWYKLYKKIRGKSLLEIAINNALKSNEIDDLIVYSKSQSVLDFSEELENKNKVPNHIRLLRTQDNETNNIPIRDFMFSAGEHYAKETGIFPDIVMYLSLHAINRRRIHIDKAINNLLVSGSDSVVSVQEEREPMFNYGKLGLDLINPGRFRNLSFDKEKLYRFNGSIIATKWKTIKTGSLFGSNTSFIEMSTKDSIQIKNLNFSI